MKGLLGLNGGLAAVLALSSLAADSSALLAIALGKFSQALTLAVSYLAAGRTARWEAIASAMAATVVLVLSAGVAYHAASSLMIGSQPLGVAMIVGGIVAACVQAWAVGSSKRSRLDRCHTHAMRMDDFVPSVLVAMAGAIVMLLGANWPDLVLALLVAGWCGLLASKTMRDAKRMRAPNRAV